MLASIAARVHASMTGEVDDRCITEGYLPSSTKSNPAAAPKALAAAAAASLEVMDSVVSVTYVFSSIPERVDDVRATLNDTSASRGLIQDGVLIMVSARM